MNSRKIILILNILFLKHIFTQHDPNFAPDRIGIVQLFHWKFADIALECELYLSEMGVGGVLISPVTEHIKIPGEPWYGRYQPISYKIYSRSGDENAFLDMTQRCNAVNVRIIVDVVINHMAKPLLSTEIVMHGTNGSWATWPNRSYPAVPYNKSEFHRPCEINDDFDAHIVRNCDLFGLPDLDQSKESVVRKIVKFFNHLIDLGVSGFRIGACKNMWPNDLKNIYSRLKYLNTKFGFNKHSRPAIYQEVLDSMTEPVSKTEYNYNGLVTETSYGEQVCKIFNGDMNLESLQFLGPETGFLISDDCYVSIDSHDLQRQTQPWQLNFKNKVKIYKAATAFMLAHPYGIPQIMSSYHFSNVDEGPPTNEDGSIKSPNIPNQIECSDEWVCEHRWQFIRNMVKFAIVVDFIPMNRWNIFNSKQISFCRADKGFMAINIDDKKDLDEIINVCIPPGKYCDVVSDFECGTVYTVSENRTARIKIPADDLYGVVCLHIAAKYEP